MGLFALLRSVVTVLYLPHMTCSAFAGNALNWVPLIGLDLLLPFIDQTLVIAQIVEERYNTYFASAQDASKQRQDIAVLINNNDELITKLKQRVNDDEKDVISIQSDLFALNGNRNAAKDTLQVSFVQCAHRHNSPST